jgi:hypothetical protein
VAVARFVFVGGKVGRLVLVGGACIAPLTAGIPEKVITIRINSEDNSTAKRFIKMRLDSR